MSRLQRLALLTGTVLVCVPLVALSDIALKEGQDNRERLEQWRQHPREFARLRKAAEGFAGLPNERRDKILKLHRELEQTPAPSQARLLGALERYVDWLDNLKPELRKKIENTSDKKTRLQLIRQEREREWLERQPKSIRSKLVELKGEARQQHIEQVRTEERRRRRDWAIAGHFWDELAAKKPLPAQLSDFPEIIKNYVKETLLPRLSDAEKTRLEQAEGHWPLYPRTLVELADKHPLALPDPAWPRSFNDLPNEVRLKLFKGRPGKDLPKQLQGEGKSSRDYVKDILTYAHKRVNVTSLPNGMWPIDYQSLNPEMRQFVDDTLLPLLSIDEKIRYQDSRGNWPDYPETIEDLARRHALRVPWPNLPGAGARLDKYR